MQPTLKVQIVTSFREANTKNSS